LGKALATSGRYRDEDSTESYRQTKGRYGELVPHGSFRETAPNGSYREAASNGSYKRTAPVSSFSENGFFNSRREDERRGNSKENGSVSGSEREEQWKLPHIDRMSGDSESKADRSRNKRKSSEQVNGYRK